MLRAVLLIVAIQGPILAEAAEQPTGKWYRNYEEGRGAAEEQGLPLLLHFYADWCGPCREMEAGVLGAAGVRRQLDQNVIGVKINVDREPTLSERFQISSLPADVVLLPNGKVLANWNGCVSSRTYAERLRRVVSSHGTVKLVAGEIETVAAPDPTPAPSLNGYCPVSITRDRLWRKGRPRLLHSYEGNLYALRNDEELRQFRSNPARYAPRLCGFDPVELADNGQRRTGSVYHTAIYRGSLYLLSSAENLRQFWQAPARYVRSAEQILSPGTAGPITAAAGQP